MRARVRTTGIIEAKFQVKDRIYRVLDVRFLQYDVTAT